MDSDFNYYEAFIQVAPDSPVSTAVVPVRKGANKSVPLLEYEFLTANPYFYTQEDLIFAVYVQRLAIPPGELESRREALWAEFFSKSHACLRASSLPKRYGWGVHFDKEGKLRSTQWKATNTGALRAMGVLNSFWQCAVNGHSQRSGG